MGECHGDDGAKGLEFVYGFGIVYETSRANYDYTYVWSSPCWRLDYAELSVLAAPIRRTVSGRRETIVSCN